MRARLAALDEWSGEAAHEVIQAVVDERAMKFGKLAQPIRVAVSGGAISPPIDVTLALLGQEATRHRLDRALAYVQQRAEAAQQF